MKVRNLNVILGVGEKTHHVADKPHLILMLQVTNLNYVTLDVGDRLYG